MKVCFQYSEPFRRQSAFSPLKWCFFLCCSMMSTRLETRERHTHGPQLHFVFFFDAVATPIHRDRVVHQIRSIFDARPSFLLHTPTTETDLTTAISRPCPSRTIDITILYSILTLATDTQDLSHLRYNSLSSVPWRRSGA